MSARFDLVVDHESIRPHASHHCLTGHGAVAT